MSNYDSIDVEFTWDGDFNVGTDGDIATTIANPLDPLYTQVHQILRSETGDWLKHTFMGANLSDFHGEPNNQVTAKAIEERLVSALTAYGTIRREDIAIRIVPTSPHQILIAIAINATPTIANGLEPGQAVIISFTYDSIEDRIFFLPINELLRQYGSK